MIILSLFPHGLSRSPDSLIFQVMHLSSFLVLLKFSFWFAYFSLKVVKHMLHVGLPSPLSTHIATRAMDLHFCILSVIISRFNMAWLSRCLHETPSLGTYTDCLLSVGSHTVRVSGPVPTNTLTRNSVGPQDKVKYTFLWSKSSDLRLLVRRTASSSKKPLK
jgi:hypothetical protein